jgi:hypothetical protein
MFVVKTKERRATGDLRGDDYGTSIDLKNPKIRQDAVGTRALFLMLYPSKFLILPY